MTTKETAINLGRLSCLARCAIALTPLLVIVPAQAVDFAKIHIESKQGTRAETISDDLRIGVFVGIGGENGELVKIFDVDLGLSDVGYQFSLTEGPNFEAATSYLTNGIDDQIALDVTFGSGSGGLISAESSILFHGDPGSGGKIDLAGNTIGAIRLQLKELTFSRTAFDPLAYASYKYTVTITSVPEPETFAMFAMGLVLLAAHRNGSFRRMRSGASRTGGA